MNNAGFDRAKVIKYLIWTFAIAYAVQICAAYVYNRVDRSIGQFVIAAMMFTPALGVLLSGAGFKGIGWKPGIKKNIKSIITAWLSPIILTAAGAALYFILFPGHFDLSGGYIAESAGAAIFEQMEE
ncbi:MAG: hypothetical protein IK056_08075, partial [Clostridia bacterium]|nr:hypothetical protein [Clostridia bacterium]